MRTVIVQLAVQQLALPQGAPDFDHIDITATDVNGVESTQAVNGHEQVPYRALFNLTEGLAKFKAQAIDAEGNPIGPSLSGSLDVPAVKTFPQPVQITLTIAP